MYRNEYVGNLDGNDDNKPLVRQPVKWNTPWRVTINHERTSFRISGRTFPHTVRITDEYTER